MGPGTCDTPMGFDAHDFDFDVDSLCQWLDGRRHKTKDTLTRLLCGYP